MTVFEVNGASGAQRLAAAGVFEFSQAGAVIESTLGQPHGEEARRELELLLLTAAEFALLPIYLMPRTLVLPLSSPMSVPGWAALAAVVKGSCSLARPYHGSRESLVTFPGDAQKLLESEPGHPLPGPP